MQLKVQFDVQSEAIGQNQPPEVFELDMDAVESLLLGSRHLAEEVEVEVVDLSLLKQRHIE